MKLKTGAWVLVADGGHAAVFENVGSAAAPELKSLRTFDQDNPRSSDQGEDKPPRAFSPADGRRSAFGGADLHQVQEDRFIKQIAADLGQSAIDHAFKEIVIVLPPVALGKFREVSNGDLTTRVIAWINKDLTKQTTPDILTAVLKALAA